MNVDKTNIMMFPKTKANDIGVKLSDITIMNIQYCRYLGIFLDDTLTRSHHERPTHLFYIDYNALQRHGHSQQDITTDLIQSRWQV